MSLKLDRGSGADACEALCGGACVGLARREAVAAAARVAPPTPPAASAAPLRAHVLKAEDVRRRVPDVSRLEKMLGTKPTMPLSAILDDIIRWKKEQLANSPRS